MANSTIPNLVAVTVPAGTDLLGVRQSGDTRDKKLTATQLLSLAPAGGDVFKVGTPANTQLGVWTGDGTLEGESELTYQTAILRFSGANGKVRGSLANSGAILNEASALGNPTLIPNVGDTATGIGGTADNLGAIVRGVAGTRWQHSTAGDGSVRQFQDLTTGIVASTTQTQGNGLVNGAAFMEVTTVANPDDVITLHNTGAAEYWTTIINTGANRLQIFPPVGDAILPGIVNASITLDVNKVVTLYTLDGTNWIRLVDPASGGGDVFKVGTPSAGLFGVWTGDGTIEAVSEVTLGGGVLVLNPGTETRMTGNLLFQSESGNSPGILDVFGDLTTPTLVPLRADTNTGIGGGASDQLALVSGGFTAMYFRRLGAGVLFSHEVQTGLTAAVGSSQGDGPIASSYNVYTTVANPGDAATLPSVFLQVGIQVHVINDGANSMDVFPALGDDLGQGLNTPLAVPAGTSVSFLATAAGSTWTQIYVSAGGAVPDPLLLGLGSAAAPTYSFTGDSDTGIYSSAANRIAFSAGGVAQFLIRSGNFDSLAGNSPLMRNVTVSATIPGFCPTGADPTTGLGAHASTNFSLIASGVELIRGVNTAGVDQVIISPGVIVDDAVTPVLAFGDGSTGFYENSSGVISVATSGVRRWFFSAGSFGNVSGSGPALQNEVPSATNPTINADSGDSDTGIGHNADDQLSLIAGGVEIARAQEAVVDQFIISPGAILGSAALPSLAFGDGDSGFRESVDDALKVTLAGVDRWTFSADRFVGVVGNGPSLQNEASTATNPTLIPALGDPSTGIGGVTGGLNVIVGGVNAMQFDQAASVVTIRAEGKIHGFLGTVADPGYTFRLDSNTGMYSGGAGSDELKFSAGGVEALSLNELNSGVIQSHQANVAITAFATGGQASATQLDESYNVLTTVATTGDSVKLPPVFAVNSVVYIKNDGANAADVFPATGDNLGAGLNTAVSLAAGSSISFIATVASSTWTQWIVSAGGGGGDVTKVGTPVNNQIGVWTGDGTLEGDANLIWDGSKLDITTGRIELPGGTAAAPPIGFQIDTGTGIYRVSNNNFGIASGGLHSVNWLRQTGQIVQTNSLDTGFTASTTQSQGNGNIFSSYTVVSTVANANDVVTAMIALAGKRLTIYNDGANILQVFPSSGDDIGAGVNSSITIAVGASKSWIANDGTTWLLIGSAP